MPCRNNTPIVFVPQAEPFGEKPSLLHLADLSLERNYLFKQLTILPSLAFKARPRTCAKGIPLGGKDCGILRGCKVA